MSQDWDRPAVEAKAAQVAAHPDFRVMRRCRTTVTDAGVFAGDQY